MFQAMWDNRARHVTPNCKSRMWRRRKGFLCCGKSLKNHEKNNKEEQGSQAETQRHARDSCFTDKFTKVSA